MKVSVIVPAWGVTPYLDEALSSLAAQTAHGEMEVVCTRPPSDGAQTAGAARMVGVHQATGEWLTFLDADDTLAPEAVERLLAATSGETDVVVSGLCRNGRKKLFGPDVWAMGPSDVFNCLVAKLFRRDLFEGVVNDESVVLGEDLMLTAQLLHRARKIAVVDDAFYHYRDNPGSVTHCIPGGRRVRDLMRVGEILRRELPEPFFTNFHDRITRDAMLLWCRYRLCDRMLWRKMRGRLKGGLLADPRHGLVKKGTLLVADCLFNR